MGLLSQLLVQRIQKFVLSLLKPGDGEAVNARATLILSDPLPGFGEIDRIVDLVDQRVDLSAPGTLRSIEPPDGYWFSVSFHCHLAQRPCCSGGGAQRFHH